jgi:hypothetical protein
MTISNSPRTFHGGEKKWSLFADRLRKGTHFCLHEVGFVALGASVSCCFNLRVYCVSVCVCVCLFVRCCVLASTTPTATLIASCWALDLPQS